jgi:small conductance mechanosensitive channel
MPEDILNSVLQEITHVITQPNALRTLLVVSLAFVVAYWGSRFVARGVVALAQLIAVRSDNSTNFERTIQLRRIETYLSILNAFLRAAIVMAVVYLAWKMLAAPTNTAVYAVGASAFVIVVIGATIGMVLRDITAGVTMIIERWYHVGDYVRVEPFADVSGVVESMNLRSTKLRSLNGEVIKLHNQHIQAVKVTPRGIRTIEIDVFVNNPKVGRTLVEKALATMPVGTMTMVSTPQIVREEKWSDHLYLITISGQTPPGREWLMDTYFVDSLKELDEKRRGIDALVRPPLVRFADPAAERSFKRAVRMSRK